MPSPSTEPSAPPMERFPELEGLRAYMAWWVFVGHILAACTFEASWLPGALKALRTNGYAVSVFVILSGFVITHMLESRKLTFRAFIINRFFRLWPALAVTAVVGIVALPWIAGTTHTFTQALVPGKADGWEGIAWPLHMARPWSYLAANLSLLHGALPDAWLPEAYSTQGWSVSLEWQFYLIAPVLLLGLNRRPVLALSAALLFIITCSGLPIGGWNSFLPQQLHYFLLGILSYKAFAFLSRLQREQPNRLPRLFWSCALLLIVLSPELQQCLLMRYSYSPSALLPISIWILTLALMLDARSGAPGRSTRTLSWLLTNRLSSFLGSISYSTYLLHFFVLNTLMPFVIHHSALHDKYKAAAWMLAAGTPLVILVSWLSFRFIEKPGIKLAKLINSR